MVSSSSLDSSLVNTKEEYGRWIDHSSIEAKENLQKVADQLRSLWLRCNDRCEMIENENYLSSVLLRQATKDVKNNPLLNKSIKKQIEPYLLPGNLWMTPLLDHIFSVSRVIFNEDSLRQAGFSILFKQPRSFIVVASHPVIPGFLFKLYLDTELRLKNNEPGWKWFTRRCAGAKIIRSVIEKKKIKYFKVPTKYIYVLPPHTIPSKMPGIDPKLAVLIVQDMNLVNDELNYAAWRHLVTPEILDELYIIISRGNGSSYRPDNIAYTHSGTFAFIDTEYPNKSPDYQSIRPYLNSEMCNYWDRLVKAGGPARHKSCYSPNHF